MEHINKRYLLKVYGKVQGVSYRSFVRAIARELYLTGFVQNMDDGTVSIIAEGIESVLDRFVELCRVGPPFSKVELIEKQIDPNKIPSCVSQFRIIYKSEIEGNSPRGFVSEEEQICIENQFNIY